MPCQYTHSTFRLNGFFVVSRCYCVVDADDDGDDDADGGGDGEDTNGWCITSSQHAATLSSVCDFSESLALLNVCTQNIIWKVLNQKRENMLLRISSEYMPLCVRHTSWHYTLNWGYVRLFSFSPHLSRSLARPISHAIFFYFVSFANGHNCRAPFVKWLGFGVMCSRTHFVLPKFIVCQQ